VLIREIRVSSPPILLVADFFQPVHGFAVELFLNGEVRPAIDAGDLFVRLSGQ